MFIAPQLRADVENYAETVDRHGHFRAQQRKMSERLTMMLDEYVHIFFVASPFNLMFVINCSHLVPSSGDQVIYYVELSKQTAYHLDCCRHQFDVDASQLASLIPGLFSQRCLDSNGFRKWCLCDD